MRINLNLINQRLYSPKKLEDKKSFSSNPFSFNTGLQKDSFEKSKEISFQSLHCSTSKFKIKEFENLRCPYCGRLMLNDEQREAFAEDVYNKKGKELAATLEKYEDDRIFTHDENAAPVSIYRPQRQEFVDIIKEMALEYPNLSLQELVQKEGGACLKPLIRRQLDVVYELEDYISKNVTSEDELSYLRSVIAKQRLNILGRSKNEFKRKAFIYDVSNSCKDKKVQEGIDEIVEKLPNSSTNVESFFVKYSKGGYTSKQIAQALIKNTMPTTEHLNPRAAGGRDNTCNYIADCSDCNNQRLDMSFYEWQRKNPYFQERMQEYLEDVQERLDKSDISGYDAYTDDMIETFKTLSQGEIILVPPQTEETERRRIILESRKPVIENLKQKIAEAEKENQAKIEELKEVSQQPFFGAIFELLQTQNTIGRTRIMLEDFSAVDDDKKDWAKINKLQGKIVDLTAHEEMVQQKVQKFYFFEEDLKKYEEMLRSYDIVMAMIQTLEKKLIGRETLIGEVKSLRAKIRALEAQNANVNVSYEDGKDYETYRHNLELLNEIEQMEGDLTKRRRNKTSKNQLEILRIAKNSLEFRNDSLRQKRGVACLINKHTIEEYKKLIASKEAQLEEMNKTQKAILEAKSTGAAILEGRTRKQVEGIIASKKNEIELRDKAYAYFKLKADTESETKRLENYKRILSSIENSLTKISDREFNERIAKVCI